MNRLDFSTFKILKLVLSKRFNLSFFAFGNADLTSDGLEEEVQKDVELINRIALTIQFCLKIIFIFYKIFCSVNIYNTSSFAIDSFAGKQNVLVYKTSHVPRPSALPGKQNGFV